MKTSPLPSLGQALVRRVCAAYFALAFVFTLAHVAFQYQSTYDRVVAELDSVGKAFEPTVSVALWHYQDSVLGSIAQGLVNERRQVVGVEVVEISGNKILSVGAVSGEAHGGLISRRYSIVAREGVKGSQIGWLTLHSSHKVVADLLMAEVVVILINAVLKAVGLWIIIVHFTNRLLGGPLRRFSDRLAEARRAGAIDVQGFKPGSVRTTEVESLLSATDQLIAKVLANEALMTQTVKALEQRNPAWNTQLPHDSALTRAPGAVASRQDLTLARTLIGAFPELLCVIAMWDGTVVQAAPALPIAEDDSFPPGTLFDMVCDDDADKIRVLLERAKASGQSECEVRLRVEEEETIGCWLLARRVGVGQASYAVVASFDLLKHGGDHDVEKAQC